MVGGCVLDREDSVFYQQCNASDVANSKTLWTPHDNSLVSLKFQVQSKFTSIVA